MNVRGVLALVPALVPAVLIVACSSGEGEPAPTVTEMVTVTAEPEPVDDVAETEMPEEPSALGTWDAPRPVGEAIPLAAWAVTFGPAEVRPDELEPGMVGLIAPLEAFRTAATPGELYSFEGGISISVVGASGVEIGEPCSLDGSIDVMAEVNPGAAVSGLICSLMPESEVDGAVWRIHQQGLDEPAYVATS